MAQHDYNIANATFPAVRSDINSALSAIQTTNSGTSRPTGAVAGQIWLDTTSATTPTLKYYDGADDISLATLDHTANTVNWLDSTVSITGLSTTATGTVLTLSDTASTTTVNLIIDNQKELRFEELNANGNNYVALKSPASLTADYTFTLPSSYGNSGQALVTDGAGGLSWGSAGFSGATENAVSSSAITLTSSSTQYQKVQISTLANSYVTLPSATTMGSKGTPVFVIENNSPIGVALDIKNNSGTTIYSIPDNSTAFVSLVNNSTTAGVWNIVSTITQAIYDVSSTINSTTVTTGYNSRCIHLTSTKLVYATFNMSAGILTGYFRVGDISGSTITFGSQQTTTLNSGSTTGNLLTRHNIIRLSDTAFILSWSAGTDQPAVKKRVSVNTVSGTTITFGTQSQLNFFENAGDATNARASAYNGLICRMSDTKFAVVYNTAMTANSLSYWNYYSGNLACQIITVSGTTLTAGTKVDLGTSTYTQPTTLVCHDTDKLCCVYWQHNSGTSTAGKNKVNIISVSGTVPTWGTSVNVESADLADVTGNLYIAYGWDEEISSDTSFQSDYGIALSTTRVFGICGGTTGNILIDISGTTPTVTYTYLISANYGSLYKPIPINSSTIFLSGKYIYVSTSNFKLSPTSSKTTTSPNETTYGNAYKTIRGNSASTSFTSYSLARSSFTIYSAIGTFSV